MSCSNIFNVQDTFGISAPAGGVVERSRRTQTIEVDEVRGADGAIQRACPMTYGTITASISGRGDVAHATLAAGDVEEGEAFVTSRRRTEYNTKEPAFEITTQTFFTRDGVGSGEEIPAP